MRRSIFLMSAGISILVSCAVHAQNLLANPGFDQNLAAWTIFNYSPQLNGSDSNGSSSSGSVRASVPGGVPQGGVVSYCAQAQETLVIANRLVDDPTQWDAIPKVCEHFISRLPGDKSLVSYCEVVMQSVGFKKKEGAAAVAKELADDDAFVLKNTAPFDWRRALIDNRPGMRELIQLYARKGR